MSTQNIRLETNEQKTEIKKNYSHALSTPLKQRKREETNGFNFMVPREALVAYWTSILPEVHEKYEFHLLLFDNNIKSLKKKQEISFLLLRHRSNLFSPFFFKVSLAVCAFFKAIYFRKSVKKVFQLIQAWIWKDFEVNFYRFSYEKRSVHLFIFNSASEKS